jgi:hypothetical protein
MMYFFISLFAIIKPFKEGTMTLKNLNLPCKVLFTSFLLTIGAGYLFALLYLFLIDYEPHAKKGIGLVQSVILKYYGWRGGSRLETALDGMMGDTLTGIQKSQIKAWIRKGGTAEDFPSVAPIFLNQCEGCHNRDAGLNIPPLTTFEEVAAYAREDMGASVKSLVRVSHIHLFGMSFIFMLTGGIFVLSEVSARWRALVIAIPFLAIWIDIGSWWFTRIEPLFAYTVIIGGLFMGISMGAQILLPLYEMWLKKPVGN